jgi:hypothetical protein
VDFWSTRFAQALLIFASLVSIQSPFFASARLSKDFVFGVDFSCRTSDLRCRSSFFDLSVLGLAAAGQLVFPLHFSCCAHDVISRAPARFPALRVGGSFPELLFFVPPGSAPTQFVLPARSPQPVFSISCAPRCLRFHLAPPVSGLVASGSISCIEF